MGEARGERARESPNYPRVDTAQLEPITPSSIIASSKESILGKTMYVLWLSRHPQEVAQVARNGSVVVQHKLSCLRSLNNMTPFQTLYGRPLPLLAELVLPTDPDVCPSYCLKPGINCITT
jgi:hypothetical protein